MYNIGILQLTQNLDDAVNGFKQGLSQAGLDVKYHYVNADGNLSELPKLANKLAETKVDLIFACSTPAAKAAVDLADHIPVVFTPVFDPVGVGLAKTMNQPGGKATGIAGMVKAADKISFMKRLLPTAKKIGVLFHTGDTNAILEVNKFRSAATGTFELIDLPISTPEDLSRLEEFLPSNLDALFVPIGRIIEENFATVVYYTDAINLPIIASHAPNVSAGALGALVSNHAHLGKDCAVQAIQILQGAQPGSIPIGIVEHPEILLNSFVACNLGIELPAELVSQAKEIYE